MQYDIQDLETLEALKFAKKINELEVNEPFVFNAKMNWVRPFGMLFAACAIKQFRSKYAEIPFRIEYDVDKSGISYAAHMGFFKTISDKLEIGNRPGEAMGNDNYIPITELDLHQIYSDTISKDKRLEMGDAIEIKSSELATILCRDDKEMHILFTYLIREILRNIPEHADSLKAWICGQYWANHTAEIAIIDEGIGVKKSLQRNKVHREYILCDKDAISCAIKAGISQAFLPAKPNLSEDPWGNSGFGLYVVSEICKELQGSFCLASGEKYIKIDSDGTIRYGDTTFQGTAVKMTIVTNGLGRSKDIISKIARQGELQARAIRNAFKKASMPSKGLLEKL